jgi:hypothetical protein
MIFEIWFGTIFTDIDWSCRKVQQLVIFTANSGNGKDTSEYIFIISGNEQEQKNAVNNYKCNF